MRIAIVCVSYNTYDHLRRFAHSLRDSLGGATGVDLKLVVVDNSTIVPDADVLRQIAELLPDSTYLKSENVGYFPGFHRGFQTLAPSDYDYIAISNVDLVVAPGFLAALRDLPRRPDDRIGMIAPSIISRTRGVDLNPKTLTRPRTASYRRNVFIFQHLLLARAYRGLSRLRAARRKPQAAGTTCFAPHGSFMIFTRHYFEAGGRVDYPCFLFAEEDFVGEECRRIQASISYQPSAVIFDSDHASTGRESLSRIAAEHVKSLRYILRTYHEPPDAGVHPSRAGSRATET